jgi:hypothetical protein
VWDNPEYEQAYYDLRPRSARARSSAVTMQAISPIADFSWDFQDLLFKPVQAK